MVRMISSVFHCVIFLHLEVRDFDGVYLRMINHGASIFGGIFFFELF